MIISITHPPLFLHSSIDRVPLCTKHNHEPENKHSQIHKREQEENGAQRHLAHREEVTSVALDIELTQVHLSVLFIWRDGGKF